ncbi:MAG: YlxM family DNA-binding protein [Firmicutes bacterium]|nr:YlxM family DNA-binding protein [Bacillota bacterium]
MNDNLEHVAETSQLFDVYGGLLTEKKREVMQLYYEDDMSLAEIAEEFGVSRAAVHDSLRSAEKSLREYEEKLGMLADYQKRKALIEELVEEVESLKKEVENYDKKSATAANKSCISRIEKIIKELEE